MHGINQQENGGNMSQQIHGLSTKKKLPTKVVAGFTAFAATAIIGASSFALAAPGDKPTKEECMAAGFTNYGQCVKEWAQHKNPPGHGYGYGGQGNNNAPVNAHVSLQLDHASNNIISVIINFFS
jgi:hypothetical protein